MNGTEEGLGPNEPGTVPRPPRLADRSVIARSTTLAGSRVAVAVCGGIAAVESVRLVRELRRHGAQVYVFPTPSALRFVGAEALAWASGQPVAMEGAGNVPYLDDFAAIVVAPLTLHTLAKCALGLADNSAALLVAAAFGSRTPVLFVPTMHESLLAHPLYEGYRDRLVSWGARFLEAPLEEGRRKMPEPETVAEALINWLRPSARISP